MSRSSLSYSRFNQKLLTGVALAALLLAAPAAQAESKIVDKILGKKDAVKTEAAKTEAKVETKIETPAVEAPKAPAAPEAPAAPAMKIPDSYKTGNIEISHVAATEKNGAYEIYMTLKNNGKNDDGISGAELAEGAGEIQLVSRVTTKELTNKEAIEKAQEAARAQPSRAPTLPPVPGAKDAKDGKDGKGGLLKSLLGGGKDEAKNEAGDAPAPDDAALPPGAKPPGTEPDKKAKRIEIPKPEYKDVTKDVEGQPIIITAEKSLTLDSGTAFLKLTSYKKGAKGGDAIPVMLHFRSAPNVAVHVKVGGGGSLLNKMFGN